MFLNFGKKFQVLLQLKKAFPKVKSTLFIYFLIIFSSFVVSYVLDASWFPFAVLH